MSNSNFLEQVRFTVSIAIVICLIAGCDDSASTSIPGANLPDTNLNDGTQQNQSQSLLPEDTLVVGNKILGDMLRFLPNAGTAFKFSDLDDEPGFNPRFRGPIDVANGTIISVANNNGIYGLDIETGEVLWGGPLGSFKSTSAGNPSPPVCVDDFCYAMGNGGELVAINVASQTILWTTDLIPEAEVRLNINPLLVTNDTIFASAADSTSGLFMVSRSTGNIEQELENGVASRAGDLLLIRGQPPGLRAYDFETLEPVWSFSSLVVSTPAVAGDVIAFHAQELSVAETEGQRIVGIDRRDGSFLWEREAGTMQSFFHPVSDGQYFYSHFAEPCRGEFCKSGYPMALNPSDGSLVWTNEDAKNKGLAPVVVNGRLMYDDLSTFTGGIGLQTGVASLNAANGSIQWISTEGTQTSLSVVLDGKVFRNSIWPTFVGD